MEIINKVIDATCRINDVKFDEFMKHTRTGGSGRISIARGMACKVLRNCTTLSWKNIGKEFGGYDHSSVMYMHKMISNEILADAEVRNKYIALCETIGVRSEYSKIIDPNLCYLKKFIVHFDGMNVINHKATTEKLLAEIKRLENVS